MSAVCLGCVIITIIPCIIIIIIIIELRQDQDQLRRRHRRKELGRPGRSLQPNEMPRMTI